MSYIIEVPLYTIIILQDSIATKLITIDCTCRHENIWLSVLLGYDLILCLALVWFSYQNAKISSHFAQEGEFAARVTFVLFLFFLPFFLLKLLLSLTVELILVKFWITFALGMLYPSIILGGLFVPKVINYISCFLIMMIKLLLFHGAMVGELFN